MKAYLEEKLGLVLETLAGVPPDFEIEFQIPNNPEHGDLATNTALKLARPLRQNPRMIAQMLVERLNALPLDPHRIESIEIAGPGFLNFRFTADHLTGGLAGILRADTSYGRSDAGSGKKAMVEYVSANPTGPLTVGHGRNAVLGDTIANLLDWTGYEVTREYYFNDAGRQMRVLGRSVQARARAILEPDHPTKQIKLDEDTFVTVPVFFPDDGYLGGYIIDIAQDLVNRYGPDLLDQTDVSVFVEAAKKSIFAEIDQTLERMGIKMDRYFNERSLYESKKVWEVVESLREKGLAYDADGAVWFKTTAFGKDKDTVLVKSSGEPTYRLPDIAYHADKLDRGFDVVVDIFGADHIATYPDVISGVSALGYDASGIEVVIYQFVTLVRSGNPVKMSTRKANYVTLDELMDEVTEDVTRFFFLMRSPNTHLEFDLDLAKEAGEKNPVFYLQYAHARICSIERKAEEIGFQFAASPDLSLLEHETESDLIKELLQFPAVLQRSAQSKEPHHVITYLRDVAMSFSKFYGQCHILGEPQPIASARMQLARAARMVLRNGLTVLGISAPEQM